MTEYSVVSGRSAIDAWQTCSYDFAHNVGDGHLHFVEEYFAELLIAGQVGDGTHRDARRRHVSQQEGDSLLLALLLSDSHQHEDVRRCLSVAGPDFLTIDDEVFTLPLCTRGQARQVRACAGEDGATLQVGVGSVPDVVLMALGQHRDLGLHTGAAGDAVAALARAGVLTNARKRIDTGVSVAGILVGGLTLRQWADRNPNLRLCDTRYTDCADVLARLDRLVAINSAVEVDLTGQVNAEVADGCYIGAVGGAVDFLRAAARSPGGCRSWPCPRPRAVVAASSRALRAP